MDDLDKEYMPSVSGLTGLAIIGICVFSIYYYMSVWVQRPETYSADPRREKVVLSLDEAYETEKGRIVYKGLDEHSGFKLGVVIFDLDPNQLYIRRIGIQEARQGFRLLETRFELIAAKKKKIRLWRLKKEAPALAMNGRLDQDDLDVRNLGPRNIFGP